jgi:hypothetical protein
LEETSKAAEGVVLQLDMSNRLVDPVPVPTGCNTVGSEDDGGKVSKVSLWTESGVELKVGTNIGCDFCPQVPKLVGFELFWAPGF